jgi:L-2-hydroxycarboxylate dehydrogenase (NAD+)
MNRPPDHAVRVDHGRLEAFVGELATAAGLEPARARLLASLLTTNDLRGVVSHGTIQIVTYARLLRDGRLNPSPDVRVVRETPVSLLVDGDGGLGYFPAWDGTRLLCEKAERSGIAVLVTRNHGHFGAAGIYARMPLDRGLLTFVTSGHQLNLSDGDPIYAAAGGSPMAFSVPSDSHPIVVDFGCMHDLYSGNPHRDTLARFAPGVVLRSIGLGEICQTWGGMLSGLSLDPLPPAWEWPGANQGALVMSFRIDLFADPERFRREVTRYVERIRTLTPIPGLTESYAAGDIECHYETLYRRDGIPLAPSAIAAMNEVADELGVPRV